MYETKGLHSRIYPYMTKVIQYANEQPDNRPWIAKSRSAAMRNERRGHGKAVVRVWTPSEWEPALPGVDPSVRCEDFPCCGHESGDCNGELYGSDAAIVARVELEYATGHALCAHEEGLYNCVGDELDEDDYPHYEEPNDDYPHYEEDM